MIMLVTSIYIYVNDGEARFKIILLYSLLVLLSI